MAYIDPDKPLSPHLQVYRPQITSVLSILHRLTGVFLSVGVLVLVGFLLSLAMGSEAYDCFEAILVSIPGAIVCVGFLWALMYHLCNGIRHLFWDAGKGFELKNATLSGWAVLVGSVVLTAAVVVCAACASAGGAA